MIYSGTKPAEQPSIKSYVPMPFEAIAKAGEAMQGRQDVAEKQNYDILNQTYTPIPESVDAQTTKEGQGVINSTISPYLDKDIGNNDNWKKPWEQDKKKLSPTLQTLQLVNQSNKELEDWDK